MTTPKPGPPADYLAYRHCPLCEAYARRRSGVLSLAMAEVIDRTGETAEECVDRYMSGFHELHCWCGTVHDEGFWHDPTHGQVDRDIQDMVRQNFQCTDRNQEFAIMLTAQGKRDRGLPI